MNKDRHYKAGIIGYGGFGMFLHQSFKTLQNLDVVAIADKDAGKAPGDGTTFYTDWKKLLEDNRVDIVSIVTPPSTHEEIACAAMERGKHVLIEKPLATSVRAARTIMAARDRTRMAASVNYMMRFNPLVYLLGALSREKVFGELRRACVENYAQDSELPEEHWFWNRDVSGGILIEHAVHFIDVINSLTDQYHVHVNALAHGRNSRQQDQVFASVLYDRGLIAGHYHSFAYPGFFESTSMRLVFDTAVINLEGWIPLRGTIRAMVNSETREALNRLPHFSITSLQSIHDAHDESRPEGWGGTPRKHSDHISSHGISYRACELLEGTFDIGESKAQVYRDCVASSMHDLILSIGNRGHRLRSSLENALPSLEIACLATERAGETFSKTGSKN